MRVGCGRRNVGELVNARMPEHEGLGCHRINSVADIHRILPKEVTLDISPIMGILHVAAAGDIGLDRSQAAEKVLRNPAKVMDLRTLGVAVAAADRTDVVGWGQDSHYGLLRRRNLERTWCIFVMEKDL